MSDHRVVAIDSDDQKDVVFDQVIESGSGSEQVGDIGVGDLDSCRDRLCVAGVEDSDGVNGAGMQDDIGSEFEVGRESDFVLDG